MIASSKPFVPFLGGKKKLSLVEMLMFDGDRGKWIFYDFLGSIWKSMFASVFSLEFGWRKWSKNTCSTYIIYMQFWMQIDGCLCPRIECASMCQPDWYQCRKALWAPEHLSKFPLAHHYAKICKGCYIDIEKIQMLKQCKTCQPGISAVSLLRKLI